MGQYPFFFGCSACFSAHVSFLCTGCHAGIPKCYTLGLVLSNLCHFSGYLKSFISCKSVHHPSEMPPHFLRYMPSIAVRMMCRLCSSFIDLLLIGRHWALAIAMTVEREPLATESAPPKPARGLRPCVVPGRRRRRSNRRVPASGLGHGVRSSSSR